MDGIFAIATLDGTPVDDGDRAILGVPACSTGGDGWASSVFGMRLVDSTPGKDGTGVATIEDYTCAFLGHLENPADLATSLGLTPATPVPALVLAALRRWGDGAPARMTGEWSLVAWNASGRELTVAASETLRDQHYFATDGRRVAVAPQLARLALLPWIGRDFDAVGLMLSMSGWARRRALGNRTFVQNIRTLEHATIHRFRPSGHAQARFECPVTVTPWQGSFEAGVAALAERIRLVVREHLRRQRDVAVFLSGGLDSTLLAWLMSEERAPGQTLAAVSSVSAPGSGVADERDAIEIAARALGLPVTFVTPTDDINVYIPSSRQFAESERPILSPRHYLYEALYDAALHAGASAVFDGAYGELGATRRVRLATPKILLQQCAKDVRDLLHGWFPGRKPVEESFHGRLAAAALARLPRDLLDPGPAPPIPYVMMPGRPLGIVASYVKSQMAPTAVPGRTLRQIYPLRDRRIIELAAGLPAHFTVRDGHSRALVRAMLRGPLPDSIALRPKGGGFSPDYEQRLLRHAAAAEDRIALQSSCGAGEWLDLDWLQQGLRALACGRPAPVREMMRIQSTAIAAEFFVWWASPAVQRPPREPG